jgi:hypothetical protein
LFGGRWAWGEYFFMTIYCTFNVACHSNGYMTKLASFLCLTGNRSLFAEREDLMSHAAACSRTKWLVIWDYLLWFLVIHMHVPNMGARA